MTCVNVAPNLHAMTLQTGRPVEKVGVRDLHDRLSHHLRHVGDGGEIIVTSRGKGIARITPLDKVDPLEDLRRQGLVREPTRPKHRISVDELIPAGGSVSDIVSEQRD